MSAPQVRAAGRRHLAGQRAIGWITWAVWLCAASAAPASAEPSVGTEPRGVEVLGFARAIPASWSASRDAPAFGLALAPRGTRTAATELAILTVPAGPVTIRPGFYGLLELEGNGEGGLRLWPSQEIHFWRGAFAFPVSVSFEGLARALCATCVLEATVQFRHESEHYTGANSGGAAIDYSDRPIYGDAIGFDVAAAARSGNVYGHVRLGLDAFLPGRSSYTVGSSLELHLRHARWRAQPFLSAFAQYRDGALTHGRQYPSWFLARALLGVAFTSPLGQILLFLSGDVGHRVGLAAYTKESTLGFGVRLALGRAP